MDGNDVIIRALEEIKAMLVAQGKALEEMAEAIDEIRERVESPVAATGMD